MNNAAQQIVNISGQPITSGVQAGGYKGGGMGRELGLWRPARQSADKDLLPQLPTMQARAYDLDRNYALTSGGHQITVDNVIGTGLTIVPNPNFQVLGLSAEWAKEWRREVKLQFTNWANDHEAHIDAGRRNNLAGLFGLALRSYLSTGEILASAEWFGRRGCRFNTSVQMIDPLRLENSNFQRDTETLRAGVFLGRRGNPIAYNIRQGGEIDGQGQSWKKVSRENRFGRRNIFHHFDAKRPGQSRGVTGLASVMAKSKMLEKFQDHALESAIVNSMYAAYIKSSMPHLDVASALGATAEPTDLSGYLGQKQEYYKDADFVKLDGVKIPHLFPDEDIVMTSANHPGPNFEAFEKAMIRHLAAGLGLSYEQLARDYSQTNYAGARAALMESWKFFTGKRVNIIAPFGSWIYSLFLEEAIDNGTIEIPTASGQSPIEAFWDSKAAFTRASWTGNAKGHIDPLKEVRADNEEVDNFMATLEGKTAERGLDWEDVITQRMREMQFVKEQAAQHNLDPEDLRNYGSGGFNQVVTDGEGNGANNSE